MGLRLPDPPLLPIAGLVAFYNEQVDIDRRRRATRPAEDALLLIDGPGADPLLHAAVINNARWCNAVCRSHGYPGQFTGRLWTSVRHALPFYPNAITLSPDATVAEVV